MHRERAPRPPEGTRWNTRQCREYLGIDGTTWRNYYLYRRAPSPLPGTDPYEWDACAVWDWDTSGRTPPGRPPKGPGFELSATQVQGAVLVFGGSEGRGARFVAPDRLVVDDLAVARAAVAAVVESARGEELSAARALARKLARNVRVGE